MSAPSLAARVRHEVVFYRDWAVELLGDATRRLGFVVRTVEADSVRFRTAFEYGKQAERNFPTVPGARKPQPKASRVTSTGQRLSRVV